MKKALFIVGPTAVGKTNLAFKISKLVPSLLISADSVQVYRGADIVSGKDKSVYTYLLDILPPAISFSVHDFITRVHLLVKRAGKENKIPLIVGGTSFYIDALFRKIDTISIPPNHAFREKLDKLSVGELQNKLKKISPAKFNRMNNSDINNKRRLIRAIEIVKNSDRIIDHTPIFFENEVLFVGLRTSMENLKRRISLRVKERIKAGAIEEVKKLFNNYKKVSSQIKAANGYKELFDYISGKVKLDQAKQNWIKAEINTGKNQMTWLKKNKNIAWFDVDQKGFEAKILKLIKHELGL